MKASPSFFGTAGEPVPAVDAEDLQLLIDSDRSAHRPPNGGRVGFSIDIFSRACKPGADISAVAYRAMVLQLLPMVAREQDRPDD